VAVGSTPLPPLYPVDGVRIGTAAAGIKRPDRPDLTVMELAAGSHSAAVFTRNAFCAAPVVVAREHLASFAPRYLVINTGNANAGTGRRGLADARAVCTAAAVLGRCDAAEVLPFSTGVIGEPLPLDRLLAALPAACADLDADHWVPAAGAILTTDTVPKGESRRIELEGGSVTLTGIAKGSGMIRPDMATMLAFVATDAAIAPATLRRCLERAVASSFNRITVDGDTSTNDACLLTATGRSGVEITEGSEAHHRFMEALTELCETLAQAIVRDGEGATKLITIEVSGGRDEVECGRVAYTIAHSPLVKTAFYASDPNWGRILAAVGRAGIADLDLEAVTLHLDEVCIVRNGGRAESYREALGQAVMDREAITVRVELARGTARTRIWTCDLSHEYVRINAEYRT